MASPGGAGRLLAAALLLSIAGTLAQGCGLLRKENRVVLNAFDRAVKDTWVESPAGIVATLPVAVPVGTAGALADVAVTLPLLSAPQAACDAYDDIWKNPQGSDFRQAILFLPKVAATGVYIPVDFAGSWLFRMKFDGCEKAAR
jgi:pyocin large subunit-like protein